MVLCRAEMEKGCFHLSSRKTMIKLQSLVLLTRQNGSVAIFPTQTEFSILRLGLFGRLKAFLTAVLLATSGAALAAPILNGISSASGSTAGGTTITLTGQNFGASPTVTFGTWTATVQSGGSATSVNVSLPAGEGTNLPVVLTAGGVSSNALSFSYLPPAITSLSTSTGPTLGGSTLTLNGSNFGLNPIVVIGPSSALVTVRSHTQITCTLPAGQGQNVQIFVFVGSQSSNSASFSYTAPAITSISPSSGPAAGGTPITINGSNFGTSPVVKFDGVVVSSTADVFTPHNKLYITSPAGFGTAKKIVITAGGQPSNSFDFNYAPPTITSISPTTGPTTGNVPITISGQNFAPGSTVTLGGNPVTINSITVSQIVFNLPPSFSGGSNLQVVVYSANQTSAAAFFSYDPPPNITSITPTTGTTEGGITITVNGSGFGVVPVVTIDGTQVSGVSGTHNQLTFTLPAGQGKRRGIQVTASGRVSGAAYFDYNAPVVTSVLPTSGPTTGGTLLTINGSNFGTAPIVTFDGSVIASIPDATTPHRKIVITTPPGFGAGKRIIVVAGDQLSNSVNFDYNAPTIFSVSPVSGPTQGGIAITLSGANFGQSPLVTIGGSVAPIVTGTDGQLTVTLPAGQGLNREVRVTSNGIISAPVFFSYNAPSLTSIFATNGPTSGGTPITINGSNFGTSPVVTFDGVLVPSVADATVPHNKLSITSPPGVGTGRKIAVITGGQISNSLSFSYDGPILTGSSSATGPTSGGTSITLTGSNFGLSSTVSIGGANAPLLAGSVEGSLIVALPAGQGAGNVLRITNSERQSYSSFFSYNPPSITSISPTSAPSSGNVPITIVGQNFGISPSVTLGGTSIVVVSSTHTEIVCTLPQSFAGGTNLPVVVTAGNQSSNARSFSYILPSLTDLTDTDTDGLNDATERQLSMYGFDWQVAQPSLFASFLTGNTLYSPSQYAANRTAGQTDVTSAPNGFGLYTLSQVQALNVDTPLLVRDALGQFKLTIGVKKSTNLQPSSFLPFGLNSPGRTTSINDEGNLEFLFTSPDNAAFFRVEAK